MNTSNEKNYYMVRAMNSSESAFKTFFENDVVAVGWSDIDFTQFDSEHIEDLIKNVKETCYSNDKTAPMVVGKKLNEIRRFKEIKNGDILIIPYYSSIRIAVAQGMFIYDKLSKSIDLANQAKVSYKIADGGLLTIPRNELSEALQRRLRVRGSTVSNLYEFSAEIDKIIEKGNVSYNETSVNILEGIEAKFKNDLLNNIRKGKTYLKTGGIGLENLVRELFECEGYSAKICSKRGIDGLGDIDVEAVKSDKFSDIKIVAQIKHHDGISSDWGIKQLKYARNSNKYDNAIYVFITSGDVEASTKNTAENDNILIINGEELVDWIYDNISKLSQKTLFSLGIGNVPQIIL